MKILLIHGKTQLHKISQDQKKTPERWHKERYNHTRSIKAEDIASQLIWKRRPTTSKENLLRSQSNKRILSKTSWVATTEISLTAYYDVLYTIPSGQAKDPGYQAKQGKEFRLLTQNLSPAKFGQVLWKLTIKVQRLRQSQLEDK